MFNSLLFLLFGCKELNQEHNNIATFEFEVISTDSSITVEQLLKENSKLAIQLNEPNEAYDEDVFEYSWIGYQGATKNQIVNLESRLGVCFPTDYRTFLSITNGFRNTSTIDATFCRTTKVDYLKYLDPSLIQIWGGSGMQPDADILERSILIGGRSQYLEEQYFLLLPPRGEFEEWRYFVFANWIPGLEEYKDLKSYFITVNSFLKSTVNENNNVK